MKPILCSLLFCSLLVATLPFGSVLADAPKSKNAKVTLVYQHELPNVPGKSIKGIGLVLGLVLGIIHLYPLSYIYSLALLLPSLSAGVRRLHDTGKSGLWLLIALIPLVGWIYVIYLYCQPTTTPYAAATA